MLSVSPGQLCLVPWCKYCYVFFYSFAPQCNHNMNYFPYYLLHIGKHEKWDLNDLLGSTPKCHACPHWWGVSVKMCFEITFAAYFSMWMSSQCNQTGLATHSTLKLFSTQWCFQSNIREMHEYVLYMSTMTNMSRRHWGNMRKTMSSVYTTI